MMMMMMVMMMIMVVVVVVVVMVIYKKPARDQKHAYLLTNPSAPLLKSFQVR